MTYSVKEIYYTLQGEGANVGRPAVFCRFTGCNLWSGREQHRAVAICQFCDTDFVGTDGPGGGKFSNEAELAVAVEKAWERGGGGESNRFVVCTGGEPLLQVDDGLIIALHNCGFEVAVETNGTKPAPSGLDWICVSPKAGSTLIQNSGDEIKVIFPQAGAEPELFEALNFRYFCLQPMDGPELQRNTNLAMTYCLENPKWRLSLQTHKLLGIP